MALTFMPGQEDLKHGCASAKSGAEDCEEQSAATRGSSAEAKAEPSRNPRAETEPQAESERLNWTAEVSHELRLPIANIRLLVETLLEGAIDDRETAMRMLTRAHGEVERLQNLVSDLLSTEQTARATDVQKQWVLLDEPARYAMETTAKFAKANGITVKTEIAPGFSIYANAQQLDQVLLNLVENAVKFTKPGGTVTVKSGTTPGAFSVTDTGIGISESEIPKIFQRFYRVDRAKSRGSTGLGLSIVKHIADLHGAKIDVASKEGLGSTFSLQFPGQF